MKNKKTKKLTVLSIICCMMLTATAFAAGDTGDEENGEISATQNQAVPFSTYYRTESLSVTRGNGKADITVGTYANRTVSHIYHDVTVYINGNWYSSERYENWNTEEYKNSFSVPASSGDYIDVYADHYTENNGLTEVGHSHKAITY